MCMIFHKHSQTGYVGEKNLTILKEIQSLLPHWDIVDITYQYLITEHYSRMDIKNQKIYSVCPDNDNNFVLLVNYCDPASYLKDNQHIIDLRWQNLPVMSDHNCKWNFWAWLYANSKEQFNLKPIPLQLDDNFNHYVFFNNKLPTHRLHAVQNLMNNDFLFSKGIITASDKDIYLTVEENDVSSNLQENGGGGQRFNTKSVNQDAGLGNEDLIRNTFCYIVGETTNNDNFLSEKSFKPIIAKRPFLHLHTQKLDRLKDLGFKTFDILWDEKRDWFEILLDLCTLDAHQLTVMYEAVQDVLDYNYEYFFGDFQSINKKHLTDFITDL